MDRRLAQHMDSKGPLANRHRNSKLAEGRKPCCFSAPDSLLGSVDAVTYLWTILYAAILIFCLSLLVLDQSIGQELQSKSIAADADLRWGMDSLYHMDRGIRGAASCATSSCHGGPKAGVLSADAPQGSEYPLWFERDPHAHSWKTISSEASVKILIKLGILRDGKIADMAGYQNCLACHNTDRNLGKDQITPRIAEGVGCESCHGPSQAWYDRHFQGPSSTNAAKRDLGMTDSSPLVHRAKICTTCHVGSRDRDMNHDIIAAGHPALYFDMAVYHEAYPKHWRDLEQNNKTFRAQLWLAGQIAAADSELELIQSRASKSLSVSTWPELSIYQCNSCHTTLNGIPKPAKTSDRELVIDGRAPVRDWNLIGLSTLFGTSKRTETRPAASAVGWNDASAIYGTSNATETRPAASAVGWNHSSAIYGTSNETESDIMVSVKELRELLQAHNPNAKRVAAETTRLRVQLHESLWGGGKLTLPDWSREHQLELTIRRLEGTKRSDSWEVAAGAYIAAWATHPKIAQSKLNVAMKTMRNGLLFPKDLMMPNFPRTKNGSDSPSLKEWNDALEHAVAALNDEDSK